MLCAIRYARERKVPYFGICLGMQTMVIEFARHVCGLIQANSTEFDPATPDRVIYTGCASCAAWMKLGGTMRLGAYPCADGREQRRAPRTVRRPWKVASGTMPPLRNQPRNTRALKSSLRPRWLLGETRDGVYVENTASRPIILGTWAASSIPNSNPSRFEPHPAVPARSSALISADIGYAEASQRAASPCRRTGRGRGGNARGDNGVAACASRRCLKAARLP